MNKLSVFYCDTPGIYYWASLTTLALLWFVNIQISFLLQASNTFCFLRKFSLFSFCSLSSVTVTSSERTFLTTMSKDLSSATSSGHFFSIIAYIILHQNLFSSPPPYLLYYNLHDVRHVFNIHSGNSCAQHSTEYIEVNKYWLKE